jgi:pyruvate formate lyase activating enzyme
LRIGGLIKISTIDFPGVLSAVIFTQGCNFFCPYCQNPELVRPFGELLDEDGVLEFLRSRTQFLDGIVISGGEPTLVDDLDEYIKKLKGLGYKVKLDTNGSRPQVIKDLLERKLVDYIALDLKQQPESYSKDLAPLKESERIKETVNLLKRLGYPHEFRTTCAWPFVTEEVIEKIAAAASGEAPLFLQQVKTQRVYNQAFMEKFPRQPTREDLLRYRDIARRFVPCFIR